jgi:hypothetical protein
MGTLRWRTRREGPNWAEFGNDDQLGRLLLPTRRHKRVGSASC